MTTSTTKEHDELYGARAKALLLAAEAGRWHSRYLDVCAERDGLHDQLQEARREIACLATDRRAIVDSDDLNEFVWVAFDGWLDLRCAYEREVVGDLRGSVDAGVHDGPRWAVMLLGYEVVDEAGDDVTLDPRHAEEARARFEACRDAIFEAAGDGDLLTESEIRAERDRRCGGEP